MQHYQLNKKIKRRKMKIKNRKGFTLIELLVVIAIIGILASVILVAVSGARQRAVDSNALNSLKSAQTAAAVCMTDGLTINTPTANSSICGSDAKWPTLPSISSTVKWSYSATMSQDVTNGTFSYSASRDATHTVTCTETGCTKNF
jgi:type IV pilus assembly protein PilA